MAGVCSSVCICVCVSVSVVHVYMAVSISVACIILHSSIGVREELGEYKVMALLIEHIELYNVFASHSTKSWRCSLVRLPSVQRHLH